MACRAAARQSEGWSARDDLHVQGCLILNQVGLLFPVNHAPMKMASLTGFAPVISCMRGRHVFGENHTRLKWCPQPDSHQQPGV